MVEQLESLGGLRFHDYEDIQASILFSFHEQENAFNDNIASTLFFGLLFLGIAIGLKYFKFGNYANYLNAEQVRALEQNNVDQAKQEKKPESEQKP